jgi:hypothetical protein
MEAAGSFNLQNLDLPVKRRAPPKQRVFRWLVDESV